MNISYKWLKRFIDINMAPEELTAVLTSLGLECDHFHEVESIKGGLKGIVVGKVMTCEDHPDSDHLHVTTVDLGDGEPKTIVCGAPNVAAGQTVVVATIGTTLYDGDKEFKIKKSKIRGVESFGMICAADEIGVGTDHNGIMVLPDNIPAGTPASAFFNVESDYVFEVELTPNRVDAASHYGVARDLKAHYACATAVSGDTSAEHELRLPSNEGFAPDRNDSAITVEVKDTEACPRYSGVTIRGVKVAESPEWLKNLLIAIGQRPINNIVDITNYILHGLGQPLHCFDAGKIEEGKVVVRTCPAGTHFTTLDGVDHTLHESDLMICDGKKPMCIAGVFGGLDSGVTQQTTDVFIESAYFNPTRVRRTARRHGLNTDSSFRYERGTDPNITDFAARLAALMIKELAGGEICGQLVDIYPKKIEEADVEFSLNYCAALTGKHIPENIILKILEALQISVCRDTQNPDILHLKVPTYRVDVTRPCDVVEEILRVYGYNNIETATEMRINIAPRTPYDLSYELQQLVSERLTGEGFMEIMNNSLSAAQYYDDNEEFPADNCVRLLNPLSNELAVLRQTLLYGGLESIAYNINRKSENLRFYEFGNVYSRRPGKEITEESPLGPFREHLELSLWLTGDFVLPSWNRQAIKASVYDLKGIILNLFDILGITGESLTFSQSANSIFSAFLSIDTRQGKNLGCIGIISPETLKKFDIEKEVIYAALDWDAIFPLTARHQVTFQSLPKTQPVVRDLALLIDKTTTFAQIAETVKKTEKKLLKNVSLFDVYEGKNLPAGKKSYGITITLQDDEKTLTDKQIDSVMNKIIEALKKLGAELR